MTSESHPQPFLFAPSSASVGTAGAATQRHERPPKILAKGPFWARLPALRAMASAVAASQYQGQSTQPDEANASRLSAAPPPIVLPDRVGTARILLSDTQSCVQKLSSRMDALCTRNEQALKEVKLAREALDTSGEKAIAEIADVVYKCQAALASRMEAQDSVLDQSNGKLSQLMTMNSSFLKLYDAQVTSLNVVTQTMQQYATAIQSLQSLSIALAPIETLVRSIPSHIDTVLTAHLSHVTDALTPVFERAAQHAVERVLMRLPMSTCMSDQNGQEHVTRGQKRKRPTGDNAPLMNAGRELRSSMVEPSSKSIENGEPSSPLLQRQLSDIWVARRLHSRGSQRNRAVEPALASSATVVVTPTPVQPSQIPIPFSDPSAIAAPAGKRSCVQSSLNTAGTSGTFGGENVFTSRAEEGVDVLNSTVAVGSCAGVTPARNTRSMALTSTRDQVPRRPTHSFEPPGPIPPSADNGTGRIESKTSKGLNSRASSVHVIGLENASPLPIAANLPVPNIKKKGNTPANGNGKTTKTKGSGGGKRKGKKAVNVPNTVGAVAVTQYDQAGATVSSAVAEPKSEPSKSASKDTSPKRTTTDASGTTTDSATLAHGPPNSPSVDASSSPIQPRNSANVRDGQLFRTNMQSSTSYPVASEPTSNVRSLIGLMNSSQDSSLLTQDVAFTGGEGAGLAAALAHVDSDIDFTSGLYVDTEQQYSAHGYVDMQTHTDIGDANWIKGPTSGESSTGTGIGILSNQSSGRPKRFLVIDDDCSAIDLLDELFD